MANQLAKSHRIVAALISPVHKTKTHPKAHALGWQGFESLAKLCDMPSMALGGMTYFDMNCAKKIMVQKVLQELGADFIS